MESDISELIETAAQTDNEEEEEDIIPVKLDDTGGDGDGDDGALIIRFWTYRYRYRYNNKNWHHTEKDVAEAIETAASTNNEVNEEVTIPVKLVDEEERFQDGYKDKLVNNGGWPGTWQQQNKPRKRML